jgi:DNA invertase Pin-like site-specific DNA recombinase
MKKTRPPAAGRGPDPIGISYVRFSTPEQREGDSLRRQTEAAAAWCKRNKVRLDTSLTLHDKGCSAFKGLHRDNPDKRALALFLKLVEQGTRVRPGDYLIVENLDRLSREHIQPALLLVLNLLQAGIRIVQLMPSEMVFDDKSDTLPVMMMLVELSRGHSESAAKSERNGHAWRERLKKTRAGEVILTRSLPAWIEERGGKLRLVPGKAAVVRRIYELAATGHGATRIARRLTEEKVPPFGAYELYEEKDEHGKTVRDEKGEPVLRRRAPAGKRLGGGRWNRSYVSGILGDRRAVGEFQPSKADGTPDGPVLPAYLPAAVSEELWLRARAGAVSRRYANDRRTNATSRHVDVFAGLIRDARDGGAVYSATRTTPSGKRLRVLVNAEGRQGRAKLVTFPYPTFERAVLSLLREVRAADVLGEDKAPAALATLLAEQAGVEAEYGQVKEYLDTQGFGKALADRLAVLEARLGELKVRVNEASRAVAHPAAAAWDEAQTLADALDGADDPDDLRTRLRTALRRVVEGIQVLVVVRGKVRLAAAQLFFVGGTCRSYLIMHQHATRGAVGERPESWWARSLASVIKSGDLDLRDRVQAAELEKTLVAAAQAGPGQPRRRRRQ